MDRITARFDVYDEASSHINSHALSHEEFGSLVTETARATVIEQLDGGQGSPDFEAAMAIVERLWSDYREGLGQFETSTNRAGEELHSGGRRFADTLGTGTTA
jgi:hypothetical protein